MSHTITAKKPLLARVRRIKGQLEGLERLIDADGDCADVLQQAAAVRGAISGLMAEILEGHLRDHLGDAKLPQKERLQDIESVVKIVRSYLK